MGGNQQATPPAPIAPANPLGGMVAGLSQAELAILGGSLALVIVDVLTWFLPYSFSHVLLAAGIVAAGLILLRGRLPAMLTQSYTGLLVLAALVAAFFGARNLIVDLIGFSRTSLGAINAFTLLAMVVVTAASAAIAYGGWVLWRSGR